MKTAIAILNWNGLSLLTKFLPSVVNNTPNDIDIYVVDNGSSDDSVEFVKNNYNNIKIIPLEKNHGFAEGYNLAIKKIDADISRYMNFLV